VNDFNEKNVNRYFKFQALSPALSADVTNDTAAIMSSEDFNAPGTRLGVIVFQMDLAWYQSYGFQARNNSLASFHFSYSRFQKVGITPFFIVY
jgi:hypothetical protein